MSFRLPRRQDRELGDFRVPAMDWYEMEFSRHGDARPSAYPDKVTGEYPNRMQMFFEIVDPRPDDADEDEEYFDGVEVSGWFGLEGNALKKGDFVHLIAALRGGEEVTEDEDLDLEDFIGQRCRGRIDHTKKPSQNDPTKILTFANVVEVQPLKRRKKTGAKADPF